MLEFTFTMVAGCFGIGVVYIVGVMYALFGGWVADRFDKVGAPYWVCCTAVALAPGALLVAIYILGNFVTGVLLSGGFH